MAGHFTVMDYIVFLGTIAVSMLIGVYYAFFKKQKTNADLLMGKIPVQILFPIANHGSILSLIRSNQTSLQVRMPKVLSPKRTHMPF